MKKIKNFQLKSSLAALALVMACLMTVATCCAAAGLSFEDVPSEAWYAEGVGYCREKGLMNGVSDTEFDPDGTMTRAMLVTALYRQAGEPEARGTDPFTDTDEGQWYSAAVLWANKNEIVRGVEETLFGTNDPVTRQQLVTILWRMEGSPDAGEEQPFADQSEIADYALTAAMWAKSKGIVNGTDDGRMAPEDNASRAEVAVILMNHAKAAEADRAEENKKPSVSGGSSGGSSRPTPTPTPQPTPEPVGKGRILVAYFSATGNTEGIAQNIKSVLGDEAELFEIIPAIPYTAADLNYNTDCRANREQNDPSARPEINDSVGNMKDYDTVFIGYPIWWGRAPRIIYTFLESYDWEGKTVIPFCTSGSSGYNDSGIKELAGSDTTWVTGRRFAAGASLETVKGWIDGLELPKDEAAASNRITLSFNGHIYTATLAENSSAKAFAELLKDGPLTITAHDYGSFEKVGELGTSLPRNDESITTSAGDIILYQGSQITVYYAENTWSFTRLGRIDDPSDLREALGEGNVEITFALADADYAADNPGGFNLNSGTVILNSGYQMPINGLGTYSLHGDTCISAVKAALRSGVRLIDTASAYGNQEEVGQAIREAMAEYGIKREEIFVITKIYPGSEMADPETSIQSCLDKLNIGYVDMMLLHHPDTNDVKAYKAMERFAADGRIRSLGLSNWYVSELKSFLPQVSVKPALVQNEIHPYYQEKDVIPYIQEQGITVQGWYPLGGRGHTAELLGDKVITEIAQNHGVSSAQVILRWNLQNGVVVIPGSSNPEHIKENTQLYHFSLTEGEMSRINALDRSEKHDWY